MDKFCYTHCSEKATMAFQVSKPTAITRERSIILQIHKLQSKKTLLWNFCVKQPFKRFELSLYAFDGNSHIYSMGSWKYQDGWLWEVSFVWNSPSRDSSSLYTVDGNSHIYSMGCGKIPGWLALRGFLCVKQPFKRFEFSLYAFDGIYM